MNLNLNNAWKWHPSVFAEKLSQGRWKRYSYLDLIGDEIIWAIQRGGGRLVVEAPPRHGKSEFISHYVPPWFLENFPDKNVIITSYADELARHWGRRVRNVFESENILTTKLSADSSAANRFNTHAGGGLITAGVGGPITGRGGNLIIIDDPIKNLQEADSEVMRARVREWFDWVLYTRAEPGATIVLLMTRWNLDDLAGYLLKHHSDPWKEIRLPALAEENDILGRKPGEALCPERYSREALLAIKAGLSARAWSALYQQAPVNIAGALVSRTDFKFWTELPGRFDQYIQSWDMTFKETKDGSFVVGQVWGKHKADFYLVDQVRARTEFVGAQTMVKTMHGKHKLAAPILVEDKANGPAIISSLNREVPGIVAYDVKGSKYARFEAVSPLFKSGNVYIPDPKLTPWVNDYIEELVNFIGPGGVDDQVDATSQALDYLREKVQPFTQNLIPRRISGISNRGDKISW